MAALSVSRMPTYYLHLRGGAIEAEDCEGQFFFNDSAAEKAAERGARGIIAEEVFLRGHLVLDERIEVLAEDGRPVATIPFARALGIAVGA